MTLAVLKQDDPEFTVSSAAREALEAGDGDVVRATDIMAERVAKDPTLYKPLMDPLVRDACYSVIAGLCRKERRAIWNARQPTAENERGRIVALANGTAATLLDFPLPGGLRLGDARRDDVSAAAEFYGKQSKDMGAKAKWLQLIAQHVPARKTVKQVMTDARLTELREEASRE